MTSMLRALSRWWYALMTAKAESRPMWREDQR